MFVKCTAWDGTKRNNFVIYNYEYVLRFKLEYNPNYDVKLKNEEKRKQTIREFSYYRNFLNPKTKP